MMLRSQERLIRSKFSEPSQQLNNFDIFEVDDRNNDFLKRSTKNLNLSGFMNFGDVRETNNLFSSRYNINNSILESHTNRYFTAEDRVVTRPKIKPTESFDRP